MQLNLLAGTHSKQLEDIEGANCCCLYALGDSNKRIQIREKRAEVW